MRASPHILRSVIVCAVVGLAGGSAPAAEMAQRRVSAGSFGPVILQALAFEPAGLCVLPPGRGSEFPEIAVLARREPAVHLFAITRSGILRETATIGLPGLHRALACGDLDGDRSAELVALAANARTVTVLAWNRQRISQTQVPLEASRSRMIVADITNDGRSDVLFFGKEATGISTVVSSRRGVFRAGPVLVPDLSVADARAVDVNGDDVADLAMADWVASRIELLFGITDTVFSEGISIPVDGEPAALDISRRQGGRRVTLAVAVPERGRVLTMGIDPTGEVIPQERLTVRGTVSALAFTEVTGDAKEDLLAGGEQSLVVFSGISRTSFTAPAEFSVPAAAGLWAIADVDQDGTADLVVVDRDARRLLVLGNSRRGPDVQWPDAYAVGRQPREAEAVDVNGDGWDDLVVANTRSGNVSVLLNRGGGSFAGQQSYELADAPTQLTTLSRVQGKLSVILASHAASDQISALVFAGGDLSKPELIVMGTGSQPRIQYASVEGMPPRLSLLVRTTAEGGPGSVALSRFEQLGDDQFLERQFLARFPRRISAIAVGEFQRSGTPDLVLATHERAKQRTTLSIAPSRGGVEFSTVEPLLVLGDSLRGVRDLVSADVDDDGIADLLVIPEAPRTRIGVVRGEGGLSEGLSWIPDVYPSRDIVPIIKDVSGDQRADIVMLDELRGAIVVLYGKGAGSFHPPTLVAPGSGVSGLAVGEFRARGTADLAITFGAQGVVTLLFDPFKQ